ncbi:MAG: ATP-dependent DNA helicase RecG [Clostridiales bacterium]|nr:ATP-dependent DNA helicase RecG [Clostridiales bacterium]
MGKSVRELKGVGEKTEKLLNKIGIVDTEDLLRNYPRAYDAFEEPTRICSVKEGTLVSVRVTVVSRVYTGQAGRRALTSVTVADETGRLPVTWYNASYLRGTLKKGSVFVLRGRASRKKGNLMMEHPDLYTPQAYQELLHSLQPVYALTAGLSNTTMMKLVRQVLGEAEMKTEFLPEDVRARFHLCDFNYALETIHFPKNMTELLTARKRLVFDEFLLFILAVRSLKTQTEAAQNCFPMRPVWTTETVIENLPYTLTSAQRNVWNEIERDLTGHRLMSRLVQGDVGSGKTILAFLAMILTAENGYQAALMVPTEVLAAQHFQALTRLLEDQSLSFCHPVLLTGSCTAREKREIRGAISSGEANLILGTHALIQEKVEYRNLGLVITDEQHRFGVRQREALTTRGNPPHVLVMSATPIPRTLAIILYGDLDISVIDQLPATRLPVKNCVVGTSYRPKAWEFLERQIREGHQAYAICPMVEESEVMEAENVQDYTEKIRESMPPDIVTASLHGKMKAGEKNHIMEEFAAGRIQLLVSTTVVEVGVNVPNATVMMVENSERFGLAQLHQLRGRVGRGEWQSYCIFMYAGEDEETKKRLEILNRSNDGFYIAGEDLKLRGPGDFFGIRQSGDMRFRLADIYNDAEVLKTAGRAAGEILALDPDLSLPQHQILRQQLASYMREDLENNSCNSGTKVVV